MYKNSCLCEEGEKKLKRWRWSERKSERERERHRKESKKENTIVEMMIVKWMNEWMKVWNKTRVCEYKSVWVCPVFGKFIFYFKMRLVNRFLLQQNKWNTHTVFDETNCFDGVMDLNFIICAISVIIYMRKRYFSKTEEERKRTKKKREREEWGKREWFLCMDYKQFFLPFFQYALTKSHNE